MTILLLTLSLAQQPAAAADTTKGRPCVIAIDSLLVGR